MPGETLPPVVAVLQGDISDLVAKVATAKKQIESMDGVEGTAHLGADSTVAEDVAAATAEVEAFGRLSSDAKIGVDSSALSGAIAGAVGAGLAGGAGGGGGGGLAALGWGTGMMGFAGFGSLLSLMGFGFEHALTTAIGLVGSLGAAIGGLGVLALGTFSKMAVGMGSDMLVMRSTITDTSSLYNALTAIQTAQLTYGQNSAQAALATQQLNTQMMLLGNTAGVKAELGLAKAAQALNSYWDQATSTARVAAVNFITPWLQLAYTYIPLIASAATRNFGIMTQAFQPLQAWLNGPQGTGIFSNLENLFAQELPTSIGALTQFVELLAKMANFSAPMTGGFMSSLLKLFTYLNTPAGFSKVEHVMTDLVKVFHDWWDLLKQIVITLFDIFKPSVGLGSSIVVTLTDQLKTLDKWLTSVSGKKLLHNLFAVHKTEVLLLLQALGKIIGIGGQILILVIPPFVTLSNIILKLVNFLLSNPIVDTFLGWGAAILILGNNLSKAWTYLKGMALTVANMGIKALNLIPGVNIGTLGSSSANVTALDANTAALTRLTEVMGGAALTGGGVAGDAAKAGGFAGFLADLAAGSLALTGLAAAATILAPTLLVLNGTEKQRNAELAKGTSPLSAFNASIATAARFGDVGSVMLAHVGTAAQNVSAALGYNYAQVMKLGGSAAMAAIALTKQGLSSGQVAQVLGTMPPYLLNFRGGMATASNGLTALGPGSARAVVAMNNLASTFQWGSGLVGTAASNVASWFYSLSAGARTVIAHMPVPHAAGGFYPAGQLALVGEQGPELFMSGSSGQIIPNNRLGGTTISPTYNVNVHGSGLGVAQLSAAIRMALEAHDQGLLQQMAGA